MPPTPSQTPRHLPFALQCVAIAAASAATVAFQSLFESEVAPRWVQAAPMGLPLALALRFGRAGFLPFLTGCLAACAALGLWDGWFAVVAASAEYGFAAWFARRYPFTPGDGSTIDIVRLTTACVLAAVLRGLALFLLCLTDSALPREVVLALWIPDWLANTAFAPFVLLWGAAGAWRGWTGRRAAEFLGLLGGLGLCLGLLYEPTVRQEVALVAPLTGFLFALLTGLTVRFELRGVVAFQLLLAFLFSLHFYAETRQADLLPRPGLLLTTGFLGVVNFLGLLLAAGWTERRLEAENREDLLGEVRRQRDELARLSDERAAQQAFLNATIDQLPAGFLILGPGEVVLHMNAVSRAWFRELNIEPGQPLHADPDWTAYRADGSVQVGSDCPICNSLRDGRSYRDVELTLVPHARPHERLELTLNTAPVLGPRGELLGAVGLLQDLSERKLGEQRLRESEGRLRTVMGKTRLLVWDYDYTTDTITGSAEMEPWFGLRTAETIHTLHRFIDFIHPEDRHRLYAVVEDVLAVRGETFETSFRVERADGEACWYLARGQVIHDAEGLPTSRYTGVMVDVTKEKADERQLRLLQSAVVHARDAVVILDARANERQGRSVLYVNAAFVAMSGYTSEELRGRSLHLLRGPDTDGATLGQLRDALGRGEPLQAELLNYRKDRTPYWVELSLVPVPDADGACSYWVMIQRDISDRKRSEQALRDREEQLRQSQKMETVGQLAGGVAHDFNNLLQGVIGNLALVSLPPGDPNRKLVAVAERAAQRAADLTRKLLGFARRNQLLVTPLDVHDFVGEVVELLRRTIDPRITLVAEIPPGELRVMADATLLNQVLLNLCLNSRDAMPQGGRVEIRAGRARLTAEQAAGHPGAALAHYLRLSVEDTGCGMAPEVRARVFEPFFTTKPIGQGTGLGLAMVDGIIKQHSGWIECESEAGRGTTFHVYLPAAHLAESLGKPALTPLSNPDLELSPVEGATTVSVATPAPRARPNSRILLVDDEEMIRIFGRAVLEQAGYEVIEAGDGVEAVAAFAGHPLGIDLVILDLMMPRLSGRDACQQMIALQPRAKILLSSGYSTDDVADIEGALGLLSKPYRPNELLTAVTNALAT